MANHESWGSISRRIVGEVIASYKGEDEKELRKLISAAYPFGERAMWPYKAWLAQVKIQVHHWSSWKRVNQPVTEGLFKEAQP